MVFDDWLPVDYHTDNYSSRSNMDRLAMDKRSVSRPTDVVDLVAVRSVVDSPNLRPNTEEVRLWIGQRTRSLVRSETVTMVAAVSWAIAAEAQVMVNFVMMMVMKRSESVEADFENYRRINLESSMSIGHLWMALGFALQVAEQ